MHALFRNRHNPATKLLVVVNCAIFLIQSLLPASVEAYLVALLGLSAPGLLAGMVWQPLTHMFLHGNLFHLLVNMIALWFAGQALETWLGPRRLLLIFFLGGILGGLLQVFTFPGGQLIGASGGVCAVLLAVTTLEPDLVITALLFFVLPVRVKAKFLGWGVVLVSLVLPLAGLDPHVGHFAHLGGALFGMAYASWLRRTRRYFSRSSPPPRSWSRRFPAGKASGAADIERILNKVTREGLHSLDGHERDLLERWSNNRS